MMDRWVIARLRPGLEAGARGLVRLGIGADAVTWAGFAIGIAAAACIAQQAFAAGLVLMLLSRLLDGLDGAVARLTQPTDRGAFLDITLDFLFYASIPLAFAWADPRPVLPGRADRGHRDLAGLRGHVLVAAGVPAAGVGVCRPVRPDRADPCVVRLARVVRC